MPGNSEPSNPPAPQSLAMSAAQRLVRFVVAHPWLILGIAVILAGFSAWRITHLKVVQSLKVLLPPDYPSVTRLDALSERMGNQSDHLVELRSPSRDANLKLGALIAEKLEQRADIRYVLFHRDRTFFEDNALLYLSMEDLVELRQRVKDRIRKEVKNEIIEDISGDLPKEGATPSPGTETDEFDFDDAELKKRYNIDEEMPEYFEAANGTIVVVKARPDIGTTDVAFARKLYDETYALITELNPTQFHPEMQVKVYGDYAERVESVRSMEDDVVSGSAFAAAILLISIGLFFRRVRAVPLVMLPLLLSVTAALGFAELVFGYLNLVSAFIFAVLLGLGIDFGIHVLGRYEDERHRGLSQFEALNLAIGSTGMSTLAGAASTAASFGLLTVAEFQGFAQFGLIAAVGVMLAMAGVFTVAPAVIVLIERRKPWRPRRTTHHSSMETSPRPPTRPMIALALTVLALGVGWSTYSVLHLDQVSFEYDFSKLGPKEPEKSHSEPQEPQEDYRDAVGRTTTLAPAIVLTTGLQQTESIHRQLAALVSMTQDQANRFDEVRAGTYVAPPEQPDELAQPTPPKSASDTAENKSPPTSVPELSEEDDPFGDPQKPSAAPNSVPDLTEEDDPFGDPQNQAAATNGDALAEDDPFGDPEKSTNADATHASETHDDLRIAKLLEATQHKSGLTRETMSLLELYPQERIAVMKDRLADVFSIYTFIPESQMEKLQVIRDIQRQIDRKRDGLTQETKEKLDKWYRYLEVRKPVTIADLPSWVTVQFTDVQGELGRFVVFWTRGAKADYVNAKQIYDAFFTLELPTEPVPTAANYFVLPEVIDTIHKDGPVVVWLVAGVLILTAIALFRSVKGLFVVLLTVGLAMLWLTGIMEVFQWKLNFFNLIAIPLLVGMGQDDALHVYYRYREEGPGNIRRVVRETGGAVFITTFTTVVGFSSLLFANHQGLLSLAQLSVVGMWMCWASSVLILPSLLVVMEWWAERFRTSKTAANRK